MIDSSRIRVFEELPEAVYREVESNILWKQYSTDAEIISYGARTTEVYFLGQGQVRATLFSLSGKEISYQDLYTGDVFGELSAIDCLPRSMHVVAIEPSRVGSMSRDRFMNLIHTRPDVATAVLIRLTTLVRTLSERIYLFGALSVKERVRKEILSLARLNMTGSNTAVIRNMPKHIEIANRINTHREAVTKELSALSKQGLIRQDQRVLTVCDVAKLTAMLSEP